MREDRKRGRRDQNGEGRGKSGKIGEKIEWNDWGEGRMGILERGER